MRRKTTWLLLIVALPSGCSLDVMSRHQDLDIHTGRIKTTTYVAFLPVCSATHDTAITKALPGDQVKRAQAEWRKISTFYWLMPRSPYYEYHEAFGAIRMFEGVTSRICFSPAALQHVALQAVELWQKGDPGGSDYLADICFRAEEAEHLGKPSVVLAEGCLVFGSDPQGRQGSQPAGPQGHPDAAALKTGPQQDTMASQASRNLCN